MSHWRQKGKTIVGFGIRPASSDKTIVGFGIRPASSDKTIVGFGIRPASSDKTIVGFAFSPDVLGLNTTIMLSAGLFFPVKAPE